MLPLGYDGMAGQAANCERTFVVPRRNISWSDETRLVTFRQGGYPRSPAARPTPELFRLVPACPRLQGRVAPDVVESDARD